MTEKQTEGGLGGNTGERKNKPQTKALTRPTKHTSPQTVALGEYEKKKLHRYLTTSVRQGNMDPPCVFSPLMSVFLFLRKRAQITDYQRAHNATFKALCQVSVPWRAQPANIIDKWLLVNFVTCLQTEKSTALMELRAFCSATTIGNAKQWLPIKISSTQNQPSFHPTGTTKLQNAHMSSRKKITAHKCPRTWAANI